MSKYGQPDSRENKLGTPNEIVESLREFANLTNEQLIFLTRTGVTDPNSVLWQRVLTIRTFATTGQRTEEKNKEIQEMVTKLIGYFEGERPV